MNVTQKWHVLIAALVGGAMLVLLPGCATAPKMDDIAVKARLDIFRDNSDFKDPQLFVGTEKHDDFGWRLGAEIDPGKTDHVIFDVGYTKFGDTTFDGLWQGVPDQGTIETESYEASVGYSYPFTDSFSAGGRIGAAYVDVSESELYDGVPYSASASETIAYGGIFGRFAINESWGVSMFFDHYPDVGEVGQTGEGDLQVYGIGVDFRFGGRNSDE